MSTPILPLAVWASGTNSNSTPANDNSLRQQILQGLIISDSTDAQPGSPAEGDAYIITGAATGAQWATFDEFDLTIYSGGTWYAFAPVEGIRVNIAGALNTWDGAAYVAAAGSGDVVGPASAVDDRICTFDLTTGKLIQDGGATIAQLDTRGKQAIYIAAGGLIPSVSSPCASVASIASGSGMPDITSVNFDPTTQEFAQFSFVTPEKWNGGTVTFKAHWSHPATTTNFGVVWGVQASAVADGDTIALTFGTRVDVTDTGGTTDDLYISAESTAITAAGTPAGGQMLFFRVTRRVGDVADTMAVDARLQGITVYVTTDQSTDA